MSRQRRSDLQALRNVASILDSARELGFRDAQACATRLPSPARPRTPRVAALDASPLHLTWQKLGQAIVQPDAYP